MANNTTVVTETAQQSGGLIPEWMIVLTAVTLLIGLIAGAVYIYFNDKKYNYLTRASAWISSKIGAEEENKGVDTEKLEEEVEKSVEEDKTEVKDPDQLFQAIENLAEEKENLGRQEERKKQRKDENLKDILTVVLLVSGINLLLRLFEMFA